jgi:predicted HTH domain antitoxin
MDHQYVETYLRKKKGYTGGSIPTPVAAGAGGRVNADMSGQQYVGNVDQQVDRVVRGSFSVQQFVDRTDALALQVETFEDKIINLTKLVKLSQALQDEKEAELRKQNHELKARLKRQEQITAKLSSDFDTFKSQVTVMIREVVTSTTNPIVEELQAFARASQDGLAEGERRLEDTKTFLSETLMRDTEALVTRRLHQMQETTLNTVQQQSTRNEAQVEQLEKRLESMDAHRLPELRRGLEERVNSVVQLAKESITADYKSNLHLHLDRIREELLESSTVHDNAKLRLVNLERQASSLDAAFTDFLTTFKESTKLQSDRNDELAAAAKEFSALHEQTRTVVETELETTKQWATRNLHRLKKHIDVINSDLLALRESHVDTTSQLQRVKCHADAEHEKLLALLQQKSREANILTEIVDKEIQGIHHLTTQHRSQHLRSGGGIASNNGNESVDLPAASSGRIGGAAGANLYDELAFTRRP